MTSTTTTTSSGPALATANAQAQSAQIAASTAALPGSGIAPTTSVGSGAGTEEGSVLVGADTKVAAEYIHRKVGAPGVLVLVGSATSNAPDTSPWIFFDNQTARLRDNLNTHADQLHEYVGDIENQHKIKPLLAPGFAGAAVIPLALNLLSWGNTATQTGGVGFTPDDYMLDVALLQLDDSHSWRLFSQLPSLGMPQDILVRLDQLDSAARHANQVIVEAQVELSKLQADKAAKVDPILTQIATITADITALNSDIGAYASFLTTLAGSGTVTWASVLQAHAFGDFLNTGGGVVFVKVHSAAAGVMSKSNLWTSLGATPLYVSTGMVVSYVYYPPTTAKAPPRAEVFELLSQYHTASTVVRALAADSGGSCNLAKTRDKGSDADKYCPAVFGR